MEAASAVKAAASMETSEARLSAEGITPGHASMIKAAEGAGMSERLSLRSRESMLRSRESMLWRGKPMLGCCESVSTGASGKVAITVKTAGLIEVSTCTIGVIASIYKR
jgi:hypothetical protein